MLFCNDEATAEIYTYLHTLSLHDALPILINMSRSFNVIPPNVLEALCRAIGEIPEGLSGTDINKYLADCGINNITPEITKWKRLYNAFDQKQHQKQNSNDVMKFIQTSVHPSRLLRFGSD